MISADVAAALPEIFLVVMAMALLLVGVFLKRHALQRVFYASLGVLVITFLLVATGTDRTEAFEGLFVVDAFARYMKLLVLLGSAVSLVLSLRYIERENMARFEFPVLILFATLGMMMMISADDLIALYIGLELQSLSLYVVAAFRRDTLRSTEAGLKYFVLSALASGMLLYGASLVYGFTASTDFTQLADIIGKAVSEGELATGLVVGLVFVAAGLAFKVSAVPFHMWTPDVYEGAPTPVTAFFATAPKVAAMALFVRVMIEPFGDLMDQWRQIVVFISILSMILGAVAAINQRNIKRLMAYSSIGHIGYALVGLAAGTPEGVRGIAIYLAIYLVMNLGTFAVILCMRQRDRMVEEIDDLKGLSRNHPMMALALGILMFSLAGVPPMAGFFGKVYVFLAAVQAELYTLAVIGVLSSVVAAFYYLRIVKLMYFDEAAEAFDRPIGRELGAVLAVSSVVILLFFLQPDILVSGAEAAAAALFAG
jgi:NADH-quinone oxidoreductase subunit N